MGTSKMELNKDDKISTLKEQLDKQCARNDRLSQMWMNAVHLYLKKDEETLEAMEKISKLQFEKFELEGKNKEFRSKVNNLEKDFKMLGKGYRASLRENVDERKASRTWKKRYYRLKKLNRKTSNE